MVNGHESVLTTNILDDVEVQKKKKKIVFFNYQDCVGLTLEGKSQYPAY